MAIFDFSDYDKEKKKKTPSQEAATQVKTDIQKKKTTGSIFDFSDYETRKPQVSAPAPVTQPAEPPKSTSQKVVDTAKSAGQKVVEFFAGKDPEERKADDQYYNYVSGVMKDNQEIDNISRQTKQEIINFLKDNIDEKSKAREVVAKLTVDNFDEYNNDGLLRILQNQYNYKFTGEEREVGKFIFKRKEKVRAGVSTPEYREVYEKLDRLKALQYARQDNDEFLGTESSNKGLVRRLVESFKNYEQKFAPYSSSRYQEGVAKNEREAIEKYQRGEELSAKDQAYLKTFRARSFNALVENGLGDMAADVMTGSLGAGMQMYVDAQMTGDVKSAAAPALAKLPLGKAKPIIEKILGNSVQLALQSNYNIPAMDAKTAEYMLPTVDYEKWDKDGRKEDLMTYLKKGDTESDARRKAYLTNLVEYTSEGLGDYIDDASPFVQKAFVGKWLKNRGIDATPGAAEAVLKNMHINSIISEVLEEEAGEPLNAIIEERGYNDPLFTPEGRERLLVETLGIAGMIGSSKVTDITTNTIANRRKNSKDVISIPVTQDVTEPTPGAEGATTVEEEPTAPTTPAQPVTVYRGSNGKVSEVKKTFNKVLEIDTNQAELIKKLADEGNADAKALYESMPNKDKVDFIAADKIIQNAYKDQYDAVQYNNNTPQLKAQGTTFYELSTGNSYAKEKALAQLYAMQKRSGKYPTASKETVKPTAPTKFNGRTVNLSNKDDVAYLKRIFSEDTVADMQKGVFKYGRNEGREAIEEIVKANIVNEPKAVDYKKEAQTIEKKGKAKTAAKEMTVYHGGNKTFTDKLLSGKGFDPQAKREAGTGGNFYGLSTTTDQKMAKDFSTSSAGNDKAAVVPLTIKKGARVLELTGKDEFVDQFSEEALKELSKKYDVIVDKNNAGGESEIRVLNPEALKETKRKVLKTTKKAEVEKTAKVDTEKLIKKRPTAKPKEKPEGKRRFVSTIGTPKLAKGVRAAAIKNKLIYGFDKSFMDLPEYDKVNVKDQAAKAVELLYNDPDLAFEIAMGRKQPPNGLLPEAVFNAVEEYATQTKNVDLLRMLATSSDLTLQATGMGQRLRLLAERNPDSAVTRIQELRKARAEIVEKRTGKTVRKAVDEEVKKIKEQIKKPTKDDWADFVKSIEC